MLLAVSCGSDGTVEGNSSDDVVDTAGEDAEAGEDGVTDDSGATDDSGDGDADRPRLYASEFTAVEVESDAPATVQLAVHACAGLYNRELGGSIYIQAEGNDRQWLEELGWEPSETLQADAFLEGCLVEFPSCVRYSYDDQQELLPSILTVGAALGAVPLDVGSTVSCDDVAFDATVEFEQKNTPVLAATHVFENYAAETTGLAMLNPGYDGQAADLANPQITRDMPGTLVDYVFSEKLFVVFLVNGCQTSGPESDLLFDIVNSSDWPKPVGVYGYNNSWNVGGYLHEAQTRCLDSRNMGAIPTETSNLSFFSTRRAPISDAGELEPNELEELEYDPEKSYVAFVVGDGDNIRFIMATRNVWLRQRLADCEQTENSCAPITWSISPHLARIAPDVLEWYYEQSHQTGNDYFILPPSGHLYAYPTSLAEEDQDRFVSATERDARILGINSTIHWDWWETWRDAEDHFLPKYASREGAIRGVFPTNVPFMFPTFTWWRSNQFFRVLTGEDGTEIVVFRPRQWRGIDERGTGAEEPFYLTPQKMADELSNYPLGTVTWVYMTSDGGLSLENSFMQLVRLLPAHVELVSTDTATRLALDAFHNDAE